MLIKLKRRGFALGTVNVSEGSCDKDSSLEIDQHRQDWKKNWNESRAIVLRRFCSDALDQYTDALERSAMLYELVLDEQQCDLLLDQEPYHSRLGGQFESLGSAFNEGDDQEIETLMFDAVAGQDILVEDLWIKVSWLSFYEADASLRFRFSFGVDFEQDVAADPKRQLYAATLTEAVFPESSIITGHPRLSGILCDLLSCDSIAFVERIIYFNAPEGGAYLHHDRERGHAGVVYAQLTGSTYWLALAKHCLIEQINEFIDHCQENNSWPDTIDQQMRDELTRLRTMANELSEQLESFSNSSLIQLINETELFVQQLVANGYGAVLHPGDIILLPQQAEHNCCWHSVFNVGEQAGQALSFAIRPGA